jgi:integrase
MRAALRGQCGEGWSVRDIRGRIQLSIRFEDGQRTTVVLDLPWAGTSQAKLLQLADQIKPLVAGGKNAAEAYALIGRGEETTTPAGATNWALVADLFREHKLSTGQLAKEHTWDNNWRLRIHRAVELLTSKPTPTGGANLLQALVRKHFPSGKGAGGTDRRLQVQYVSAFLRWAVDQQGVDPRWLPPADLKPLVGVKQKGQILTTFIRDDQICRLLEGILSLQWRTAVGLVACFGLRPGELGYIRPNGDELFCSFQKRTARKPGGTPARSIIGLDPAGLEGLSANLLAVLAEQGSKALPSGCRGDRAGEALYQYLRRNPTWQALVLETAEMPISGSTGNELVPYSLRHAYAYRASEEAGWSDKVAALQMGHSLLTHNAHYSGTGEEMVAVAKEKARAAAARRQLEREVAV